MSILVSSPTLTAHEAKRAARNAGALAAARILSSGVLLIWQLLLGRLLGDSDFGVYGTVGALYTIGATITAFGMGAILIRDVARRADQTNAYFAVALTLQTGLALVAYVTITVGSAALGYSETIRALAGVAALSLFTDMSGNIAYDLLLARERMIAASLIDVLHIAARITLAGVALAAGFGLMGVYIVTIFTGIGRAVVLWIALRHIGAHPTFPVQWSIARPLIVNALPLALSAVIVTTYVQIDKLMTTSLLTEADTGHLSAAFVILVGMVEVLSTTVIIAVFPLMSRAYAPDQPGGGALFRFMVEKLSFFTLLIALPIGLIISLFSAALTLPLFGADFAPTADILRVLIWYAVVTMVVNVLAQGMMAQNRQRHLLILRTGGLLLKLALNMLLLPRIGVVGAAAASVSAEIVVLTLLGRDYRFGVQLRAMLPAFIRLALVVLMSAGVMLVLGMLHPLIGMIGGAAVYAIGVIGGGILAPDDYDLLYRLIAAMPGGALIRTWWRRDITIE